LAERAMTLPTGTAVRATEISGICQTIRDAISCGPEIHERLLAEGISLARVAREY